MKPYSSTSDLLLQDYKTTIKSMCIILSLPSSKTKDKFYVGEFSDVFMFSLSVLTAIFKPW